MSIIDLQFNVIILTFVNVKKEEPSMDIAKLRPYKYSRKSVVNVQLKILTQDEKYHAIINDHPYYPICQILQITFFHFSKNLVCLRIHCIHCNFLCLLSTLLYLLNDHIVSEKRFLIYTFCRHRLSRRVVFFHNLVLKISD